MTTNTPTDTDATIVRRFTHEGLRCCIGKLADRHYCGYVETAFGEEAFASLWDAVDVHAGLSYGPDSGGWVGFACNRVGDVCVDDQGNPLPNVHTSLGIETEPETTWTLDDVERETRTLAEQLANLQ